MLALKYLLVILGIGLFGSSGALVAYDIYLSSQLRRLLGRRRRDETTGELLPKDTAEPDLPLRPVRCGLAQRLAAAGVLPLLLAFSIAVVPDGFAGVRVSQIWGARPGTLYPGVHVITPLVDTVELYDTREQVDKLQIMMVPIDGENFFANDVLRSAFSSAGSSTSAEDPEDGTPVAAAQKRSGRRP